MERSINRENKKIIMKKIATEKSEKTTKTTKATSVAKSAKPQPAEITPAADKAPVKKAAAKKPAAKKASAKSPIKVKALVDVGFGNSLFIRGNGAGLSWEKGQLMENATPSEWIWSQQAAGEEVQFKFLINDEIWSEGEDYSLYPDVAESVFTPNFA
jgi:hypothetical protein